MQDTFLKDIVVSVAGEKARGIVDLLLSKGKVNEFLIAKKLSLTINQTRNILYKLADEGLVSFMRKKDSKKGGWYTYYWSLNQDKSLNKFHIMLVKNTENLRQQIHSKKTERFFSCPNCNIEFTEEAALIQEYTCPECGETLQFIDQNKEIIRLEKEIVKNRQLVEEVMKELEILQKKHTKLQERRLRSEKKKKESLTKNKKKSKMKKKGNSKNKLKGKSKKKKK